MGTNEIRSSNRIEIELPIEIGGTDCLGSQFFARTHTLVVGRDGGKIKLDRKLVPEQEVTIRCLNTGREAEARIVGQLGKGLEEFHYGVKFLNGTEGIWGIEFPPSPASEDPISRVRLECIGCKNREAAYLDDFELEVLEANGQLSRSCRVCRDVSLWRKSLEEAPEAENATRTSSASVQSPFQDRRRETRRGMHLTACIRTDRQGEDLVKTRSVSRHGLCFTSPWQYVPGETIEVAVPYSAAGGNIFLPAKIVRLEMLAAEGMRIYGVAFQ